MRSTDRQGPNDNMRTTRVLHLSHTDIRSDSRILKEMKALSECDGQYSLYGLGVAMDEGGAESALPRSFTIHCVTLRTRGLRILPAFVRHAFSLVELMVKMSLKALAIAPDIVHSHDTVVLPLAGVLRLTTGARIVYDAHELESERNGLTRLSGKATLLAERVLWRFVDYLIVVSPSIQEWYQETVGPKPSEVILNSPVPETTNGSPDEHDVRYLRDKYGIAAADTIFIYVGFFAKGRGIENLLAVFSELRGVHLVLMGCGELSGLIAHHAEQVSHIHVHPSVPYEAVVDIVRSADVGLCLIENASLSDYYCLPNKLFEYCFAGIPVIASDFPDIADVVKRYRMGVCCGQDPDSIRRSVDLYLSNTLPSRIDIAQLEPLSWNTQATKLLRVYAYVRSLGGRWFRSAHAQ